MIKSFYKIYDCETGGLDFNKNPITQYACIILDPKTLKEVDRWETFVKPYNNLVIEEEALRHTMVSMSDVNSGINLKRFVKTSRDFDKMHQVKGAKNDAGRLVPVGHNIPFDNGFLSYAYKLEGEDYFEFVYPNFIDTFPLAKMAWGIKGDEKINLSACCDYAKIKITDAHGAMNDVEATTDLLKYFIKKFRAKNGTASNAVEEARAMGREFFEFKCGVK